MSRRFEGVEVRRDLAVDEAKAELKRLGDRERLLIMAWLCVYFDDEGALRSPQLNRKRRRITLDDIEYWLVRVPNRASSMNSKDN